MKTWTKLFVALIGLIAGASQATAQTVPYYVEGPFTGNLLDLSAVGSGIGLHMGEMEFDVAVAEDAEIYDVQTAADGSTLVLRRVDIEFEITPADGGLFNITGIDTWEIVGGTGGFRNAKPVEGVNIISMFFTPEPVSLADPTHIPAAYVKTGQIDLGNKGRKD